MIVKIFSEISKLYFSCTILHMEKNIYIIDIESRIIFNPLQLKLKGLVQIAENCCNFLYLCVLHKESNKLYQHEPRRLVVRAPYIIV